ncbi:MAG: DUF262 domain-containing protein [Lachnospiraceae bacterium]|nr:DUF262 domain-containing protein [Lachnospiraceae bacterium]
MAFGISENTTSYFINNKIDLPRFQRKASWKDNDNFKLCISVFKGYPIGVIIVNEMGKQGKKYLLDGRQRRNALTTMYSNPVAVYAWAKKFVNFQDSTSEDEVKEKFREKISEYLQIEFDKATEDEEDLREALESKEEIAIEKTFDAGIQGENMHLLLDLILMVHGKFKKTNRFEGIFRFDKLIPIEDLEYSKVVGANYEVDPVKLKKYIKNRLDNDETSIEEFFAHLKKRYKLDDKTSFKIYQYMNDHWDYIEKCFETIRRTDEIIINARIGLIRLIDASPLDAQNIFSLVNGGGTKLTAEELLSARPYWNVAIENPSDSVKKEARSLYEFLNISVPQNVVRWDACATVLSRIDTSHLVFSQFDLTVPKTKDANFTKKLTLGFKLISAVYVGGISSISVKELENEQKYNINWDVDIEKFIFNFNIVMELLYDCDYFKYMMSWKQSIMSLMGNAVALEFASLIYKKWIDLDKPTKGQSKVKELQKNAIILCDKLMYEYSCRIWSGSGDSRLARDLQAKDRFEIVGVDDWYAVIDDFAKGKNATTCKGIIYHYYCLKKMRPILEGTGVNAKYEIDHIYAQAQFDSVTTIDKTLMESVGNKALLPKLDNISKGEKAINQLRGETWLYDMVRTYTGIKEKDVDKYSDIVNIENLIEFRIKDYKEVFSNQRISLLNSSNM